jgi:hypothetical protein
MALDVAGPATPEAPAELPARGSTEPAVRVPASGLEGLRRLGSLAEVVTVVERARAPLYVRVSGGPGVDRCTVSRDHESGCVLPGLSANPMSPEPWWDRPVEDWVARQLCQYAQLADEERRAWLLTGEVSGHGPDCEPLLVAVHPVAVLDDAVLDEARDRYEQVFDAGLDG